MRIRSVIICLFPLMVLAGRADTVFSRPPRKTFSPRWPEKTVLTPLDTSGETWRQTGIIPRAYHSAQSSIRKRLTGQGCVFKKKMSLSAKPGQRRELTLWQWENETFLVMISEAAAARTDIAWGVIPLDNQKRPIKTQLRHLEQGIK